MLVHSDHAVEHWSMFATTGKGEELSSFESARAVTVANAGPRRLNLS